ncbi:hypothetical protein LOZ65_006604 [Ophidiomyces ophidiicola]|nr:hypothetical protein LOZ65_006604 [Ophidiomyces ophidiicola]
MCESSPCVVLTDRTDFLIPTGLRCCVLWALLFLLFHSLQRLDITEPTYPLSDLNDGIANTKRVANTIAREKPKSVPPLFEALDLYEQIASEKYDMSHQIWMDVANLEFVLKRAAISFLQLESQSLEDGVDMSTLVIMNLFCKLLGALALSSLESGEHTSEFGTIFGSAANILQESRAIINDAVKRKQIQDVMRTVYNYCCPENQNNH